MGEELNADGIWQTIEMPGDRTLSIYGNGGIIVDFPDDTSAAIHQDGTTIVYYPDGRTARLHKHTASIDLIDGREVSVSADRTIVKDADGRQTYVLDDSTTVKDAEGRELYVRNNGLGFGLLFDLSEGRTLLGLPHRSFVLFPDGRKACIEEDGALWIAFPDGRTVSLNIDGEFSIRTDEMVTSKTMEDYIDREIALDDLKELIESSEFPHETGIGFSNTNND